MNKPKDVTLPPRFVLTAILSGGLTIAISGLYILLSLASITFRFNCDTGSTEGLRGSHYFWHTIFSVYFLKSEDCGENFVSPPVGLDLTGNYTVFVCTILIMCTSVLCLVSAILLIVVVQEPNYTRYIYVTVFSYVGCCTAALIVDLTLASLFGIDYANVTERLKLLTYGSPSSYQTEVIRQGAMILMTITLKGYVTYAILLAQLVLLLVYLQEFKTQVKSNEHPIHKLGVLNAYDQPRMPDEWSRSDQVSPYSRGGLVNNAFIHGDDQPNTNRLAEPQRFNDYPSRSVERTESWRDQNLSQSSRPFSYLEDVKRQSPRPPPSPVVESPSHWRREPSVESPWRRDPPVESLWRRDAPPHVPAPDYSPTTPRRLKSALKPGYM